MLLTLPNELQADVFSLCDSVTLASLARVSHHVHVQAIQQLYKRRVTVRSWDDLLGLFSLPPPSSYASPALALEHATTRRAELELIKTLVLDFPRGFDPRPVPPNQTRGVFSRANVTPAPKGLPSAPVFGPIPKLLGLRSNPLYLDNVIVAHGEPIQPIAPLLQCVNPVYFGTFASGCTLKYKLFDELNWKVYSSFGLKVWTRLERWSFGPRRSYMDDAGVGPAYWIGSSPFKAAAPLAQATVHLELTGWNARSSLKMFRAMCPGMQDGKAVKLIGPTSFDVQLLKERLIEEEKHEQVREWLRQLEIEHGDREWTIDGKTVWPEGLLLI